MFCPNCGEEFEEGEEYCSNCGAKLPAGGKSSAVKETSKPTGSTWNVKKTKNWEETTGAVIFFLGFIFSLVIGLHLLVIYFQFFLRYWGLLGFIVGLIFSELLLLLFPFIVWWKEGFFYWDWYVIGLIALIFAAIIYFIGTNFTNPTFAEEKREVGKIRILENIFILISIIWFLFVTGLELLSKEIFLSTLLLPLISLILFAVYANVRDAQPTGNLAKLARSGFVVIFRIFIWIFGISLIIYFIETLVGLL